jgi:hypothetical protein
MESGEIKNILQLSKSFYKDLMQAWKDEEWDEIALDKGSCVEFIFINQNWYILSSDGLKIW